MAPRVTPSDIKIITESDLVRAIRRALEEHLMSVEMGGLVVTEREL